ncbi:MAG TPA: hypothetical protein VIM70_03755 [Clostridium sp.]|uniref:hypothetical protein n=1 Tax=Clostridium sp. TaxID=1506 RepID=UPI002F94596B
MDKLIEQEIVEIYKARKQTIRQIAKSYDYGIETVRRVLLNEGYSNGLKKR